MTLRQALLNARDLFRQRGYETPYLDAVVLLSSCMGIDKAHLLASYGEELSPEAEFCFQEAVHRRLSGLPVSYILRRKEFYGLSFYVDERVLVPRPETELLVETALRILREDPSITRVHDACTGSGCIPIALSDQVQKTIPGRTLELSASDLSEDALEVFRINCLRILGYVLPHIQSDLLENVEGPFDMITTNPPYVCREEVDRMISSGWPEPRLALDGGEDGLGVIVPLATQALERLRENGYLLVEGSDPQAEAIQASLNSLGYESIEVLRDLSGKRRVTVGRKG
jgi:release factor glutamine methyltransferase